MKHLDCYTKQKPSLILNLNDEGYIMGMTKREKDIIMGDGENFLDESDILALESLDEDLLSDIEGIMSGDIGVEDY